MAILRATVVLNHRSGIPKDASRNVWHFEADNSLVGTLSAIGGALGSFYNGLAGYLSGALASTADAHRVEFAEVGWDNVQGRETVSPILGTVPFQTAVVPTNGVSLPNEVAICLSFRAAVAGVPEEQGVIRPRSRRRGRVFLGPWNTTVIQALSTLYEPQVTTAVREAILDGYDTAQASWIANASAANVRHGVFSRTDGILRLVEHVSVDDEFDTVRRRGQKPGVRMARAITPAAAQTNRTGVDAVLAA